MIGLFRSSIFSWFSLGSFCWHIHIDSILSCFFHILVVFVFFLFQLLFYLGPLFFFFWWAWLKAYQFFYFCFIKKQLLFSLVFFIVFKSLFYFPSDLLFFAECGLCSLTSIVGSLNSLIEIFLVSWERPELL